MRDWRGIVLVAAAVAMVGVIGYLLAGYPPEPPPSSGVSYTPRPDEPEGPLLERPADGPLDVLIAGDSLTRGLHASTEADGYAQLVLAALREGGPVDASLPAITEATTARVAGIVDPRPGLELAVIELGTNDVGADTPLRRFRRTYRGLLDDITGASPDAVVVCLGVWQGYTGERYSDVIEEECEHAGGKFASLRDLFELRGPAGRQTFAGPSDTFHPNDRGHAAIADLVLTTLGQ